MAVIPERAILRMCKSKVATVSGIAIVEIKVPGVYADGGGRFIEGGEGWFETFHEDDFFEVCIKDNDNVLGYGAGFVVGSYTESDLTAEESGWYIPLTSKKVHVAAMAGLGWVPAEMYLCVTATKGNLNADTFRMNFKWGVKDVG